MNIVKITKAAARLIVGAGVTHIVSSIIEKNVETENVTQKVTTTAASIALGLAAADAAGAYTDKQIDAIFGAFSKKSTTTEEAPESPAE